MEDNYDISNVSVDFTPRINKISESFVFHNNKKNRRSRNLKSLSSEKTQASINQKKVNFSKIEIIRIENYKKYNKNIKYKSQYYENENRCLIF